MHLAETEQALLAKAIHALHEETGLLLQIVEEQANVDGTDVDAIIQIPNQDGHFAVEIKKWAQQANLGALVEQVKRLPLEGILVADYVNPNMAGKLKALDIEFIDGAGNAYINKPPLYIQVVGNKLPEPQLVKNKGANRTFDTAGLKLAFGLLCDPELVAQPYRTIAEQTGLALGTVGQIITDMKQAGFILDRGNKTARRLVHRRKLLDRWVEAYPEKLKPKLLVGHFINYNPGWWQHVDLIELDAYWGGEVAAAKYTDYLKPQALTMYCTEQAGKQILAKARLKKTNEWTPEGAGILTVYRPFWPVQKYTPRTNRGEKDVVDPVLAYADLIATGDSRNIETARMIYEQYIAEHIGEN
jgi:hypothetical protein